MPEATPAPALRRAAPCRAAPSRPRTVAPSHHRPYQPTQTHVPYQHWAAGHGHTGCVEALLASGSVEPDDRSGDGATPFLWASCGVRGNSFGTGGHVSTVKILLGWRGHDLGAGAGPGPGEGHPLLHACLDDRNTCVHWAAWGGDLETLRYVPMRTEKRVVSTQTDRPDFALTRSSGNPSQLGQVAESIRLSDCFGPIPTKPRARTRAPTPTSTQNLNREP